MKSWTVQSVPGTSGSSGQCAACFAEKRLVVVANSPWFGNGKVKEDDPEPLLSLK